jgi:RimJ/RimL family protein N-acetyltransferase
LVVEAVTLQHAVEFLDRAGPLLEQSEARHNLILGLAGTLRDRPEIYEERYFWVVEDDGLPVAAALITPPWNLVLADAAEPGLLEPLADVLQSAGVTVPGATGNLPTVEWFNTIWADRTGVIPELRMAQGVFALCEVIPADPPPGRSRPIGPADRDLIIEWFIDFGAEALPEDAPRPQYLESAVERRAANPLDPTEGIWVWEDPVGDPVSVCAYAGPTPNGIRIGPVYTPPDLRRRGYGAAVTAGLSSWLLGEGGYRSCFLYTDLSNPTSNAIYRRIGYEQVAESAEYGYGTAG